MAIALIISTPMIVFFMANIGKPEYFTEVIIFASIFVVIILFLLTYNYLEQNKYDKPVISNDRLLNEIRRQLDYSDYRDKEQAEKFKKFELSISSMVSEVGTKIEQSSKHELNERQKQVLFEKITNSVESNLTSDFYEKIGDSIKFQIAEDKKEQVYTLTKQFASSILRLNREIELLTKKANFNLLIGSFITVIALVFLGYFVVKEDFNSIEIINVTLHFISRLSLVIFIELFSFFFLKLYRTSLSEIKYYQNELTNVELQQVAIFTAINFGNSENLSLIIKELSTVERNFKLQKGESTVELEKNKIEISNLKDTLKTVINAIPKRK